MFALRIISWIWDVNKKGNINPVQKLILLEERTLSAILFFLVITLKDYIIQNACPQNYPSGLEHK